MPEPLRILLASEPGIDGVFRHVDGFARYLIEQGHEVHLAYSDKRHCPGLFKLIEFVQQKGGRVLNLAVPNAPCAEDLPALLRLHALARDIGPQVIHGQSSKAGVLTRSLRFMGIPGAYFYTPHAYYGLGSRSLISTRFYNGIERFFAHVGTTINVSEDERRFALQTLHVPPERCVTINNPVDTQAFRPVTPAEKIEQRRNLKLPENALILGSMARLTFQKDPATLYRSFARARERGLDAYLLHVGKGDPAEESAARLLAESLQLGDRLIRHPYFRNPLEFYSSVDGLILTSRYEGTWPYTLLEALACDLPIINGTGPGTSDLPSAGLSHCWTAGVGDVEGFAQAIQSWAADRKAPRPSNHRPIAIKRFSPETCFGAVINQYRIKSR
jgi:glycosyltransferase involved in cell wall biosynthesis